MVNWLQDWVDMGFRMLKNSYNFMEQKYRNIRNSNKSHRAVLAKEWLILPCDKLLVVCTIHFYFPLLCTRILPVGILWNSGQKVECEHRSNIRKVPFILWRIIIKENINQK